MYTITQTEAKNRFYEICKDSEVVEVRYYKDTVAYIVPAEEMDRLKGLEDARRYHEMTAAGLRIYNRLWNVVGRSTTMSISEKSDILTKWLVENRLIVFDMIEAEIREWQDDTAQDENKIDERAVSLIVMGDLIDKNLGIKK